MEGGSFSTLGQARLLMMGQLGKLTPLPIGIHGLPELGQALDLPIVVRAAAAVVDLGVVHTATPPARTLSIGHLPPPEEGLRTAGLHGAAAGAFVDGRLPPGTLSFQAAAVDPLRPPRAGAEMQRVFGEEYPTKGMLMAMGTHSLYPDT